MKALLLWVFAVSVLAQSVSLLEQADEAFRQGDLDRAATLARQALTREPGAVHGHMILGVIAAQKNQWDTSNRHFEAVIRLEPGNPFGYFYLGQARHRTDGYSSVLVKPVDRAALESIKAAIKNNNRLKLQVRSEYQYYADQMNGLIGIKILVGIVAFFMVLGAVLGTMNTMFSAIAPRQRELATLRALGFNRRTIIGSVVLESAIVALAGGAVGLLLSLPVNGLSSGTTNWSTFSELAFTFRVDAVVALSGFIIALNAGIYGGALPAIRAARMPITTALRDI